MYRTLMFLHLATIVPCILMGPVLFAMRKGTVIHRRTGAVYMVLMLVTATITLFMPAAVGYRLFDHFGFIHLFSLLTLYSVPEAFLAIRAGNVGVHKRAMIGLYVGGIVIAGGFTLMPGRYLHHVFFGP